jgi:hypothetical protein
MLSQAVQIVAVAEAAVSNWLITKTSTGKLLAEKALVFSSYIKR